MTWDITVTPATQDIEPNVDHGKDSQRISREHEEQRRRCHGMEWIHQHIKLTHSFRIVW